MDQNKSVTKKQLLVGNFIVSSDLVAWPAKKSIPLIRRSEKVFHPQTLPREELVAFDIPQLSAIPIENTTTSLKTQDITQCQLEEILAT